MSRKFRKKCLFVTTSNHMDKTLTDNFQWCLDTSRLYHLETLPLRADWSLRDYFFWILRDYALDTSRLLVTSRLFVFWIPRDYSLDTSRLYENIFFKQKHNDKIRRQILIIIITMLIIIYAHFLKYKNIGIIIRIYWNNGLAMENGKHNYMKRYLNLLAFNMKVNVYILIIALILKKKLFKIEIAIMLISQSLGISITYDFK